MSDRQSVTLQTNTRQQTVYGEQQFKCTGGGIKHLFITTMSNRKDVREIQTQHHVTSRCLAIVLTESDECVPVTSNNAVELNGKDIFDDFKLRNKTCYWNPALIESIEKLEYIGFVYPCTILVQGSDLHLENLRTAWGRRVLNNPANYKIVRIGDVNGIEMEVIPQTQFIPLPEILCLIIMDLNNKQVIATLDVIHEQLKQCYKGMSIPSPQLTYDTLGSLIRERKVFHTGSGYFVVTPDTYRLPDDPTKTLPLPWLHYNPMYIPVLNQHKNLMRSISCQVTLVEEPQQVKDIDKIDTLPQDAQVTQHPATDKPRLGRSLSARRVKDKGIAKDTEEKDIKRSHSVRGREDKKERADDVNLAKSNVNKNKDKAEKKSLISKIFGRRKKTPPVPKEPVKEVECATFSAQFPPPEWVWYKEQVDKQHRIQKWVQDVPPRQLHGQISNEAAYGLTTHVAHGRHGFNPHGKVRTLPPQRAGDYVEINDIDLDPNIRSALPPAPSNHHEQYEHRRMSDSRIKRREHKSHRRSLDKKTAEQFYHNTKIHHVVPTHHSNIESPSLPYHPESLPHPHKASLPLFSSTPRAGPVSHPRLNPHCEQVQVKDHDPSHLLLHHHHHRGSKTKRKSHRQYEIYQNKQMNDISTEYFGRMPRKDSSFAKSCDSGVNCVGLGGNVQKQSQTRRHNVPKSVKNRENKPNNLKNQNDLEANQETAEKAARNQVVCKAEINTCVQRNENEYVTMETVTKKEDKTSKSCLNSLNLDSIMESDVSYDTVIDKDVVKKDVENVTRETGDLALADSGFCSPRVVEGQSPSNENNEIQSRVEDIKKASNSSLCPKNVYQKSEDGSHTSDQELPGHDKENKHKMLNNMKFVSQERSVLTHYNQVQHYTNNGEPEPMFLQQIPFKFNFDDDYEVVGVV